MATNAYLYMPNEVVGDVIRSFRVIRVHFDGYLSNMGPILAKNFTDPEKVKKLFDLGDVSILAPEITRPVGHTFDNPVSGYTVFYGRDRGEKYCEAGYASASEMPGRFNNDILFNTPKIGGTDYIFDGKNWFCYDAGFDMADDNIGEVNAVLAATGNI